MQLPSKTPVKSMIRHEIFVLIDNELNRVSEKSPAFNSTWEGWGVLDEKIGKLTDAIRTQKSARYVGTPMIRETVQCAAMLIKMLESLPWYNDGKKK